MFGYDIPLAGQIVIIIRLAIGVIAVLSLIQIAILERRKRQQRILKQQQKHKIK